MLKLKNAAKLSWLWWFTNTELGETLFETKLDPVYDRRHHLWNLLTNFFFSTLILFGTSNHQFANSPINEICNEIFINFLFSATFLYWNQPTFSKSWMCLKRYFTANNNTKFRQNIIRDLVKINWWFDVTNKIYFYCLGTNFEGLRCDTTMT